MKRFSFREFGLLCAPLALLAGFGFFAAQRKPAALDEGRLRLQFHVGKPTTLEAFRGVDAAFITELKGPNTQYGVGKDPLRMWRTDPFLEVQTARGVQKSHSNNVNGVWREVWKGGVNAQRWRINSRPIPPGRLRFGLNAVLSPISSPPTAQPPRLSGVWTVNRAQIQPFRFAALPRAPLVELRSARILQVNANGNIRGEAIFDLRGAAMNDQTAFDYDFQHRNGGLSSGYGSSDLTPQTPTRRVREWTIYKNFDTLNGAPIKQTVFLSGRVSAAERWPLAFEFEPFDYARAKPGQKLKFKSWPAPIPKLEKPLD